MRKSLHSGVAGRMATTKAIEDCVDYVKEREMGLNKIILAVWMQGM